MKKLVVLMVVLLFAFIVNLYAQSICFGEEQIISVVTWLGGVYIADLDGDGDMDAISASGYDDKIAWYENDGSGNYGEEQIITTNADDAIDTYAADLDGDGDMDVLSASTYDDKIAWYENDGSGNFGTQQVISTAADGAGSVYAEDLDGDDDMDVLSASPLDDKIAWYENDGSGNFGTQQIISTDADGANHVYVADLDGDDDMDVLSASSLDNKIAWYENDGSGNFGAQQIISTDADGANHVYAEDLDGDGDMDVLSASGNDDKIAWFENDGSGNFSEEQIISTYTDGPMSVKAADLDNDGDMDVLSASGYDNKVAWYENDGSGNFSDQYIITTNANYAHTVLDADLDGDGDMDVLSASFADNKIAWYENIDMTGFYIPNPIEDQIISFNETVEFDVGEYFHFEGIPVQADITVENSDPTVAIAVIEDNVLTITGQQIVGETIITIYGEYQGNTASDEFEVSVFNPTTIPVVFHLYDSYGNGWEGAFIQLYEYYITLETGYAGEVTVFLEPGTHNYTYTSTNFYTYENSWTINLEDGTEIGSGYGVTPGTYDYSFTLEDPATGTLLGIVSLEGTGNITDVDITVNGFITNPDDLGNYSFVLPVGDYTLSATLEGYNNFEADVEILESQVTTLNFEMTEAVNTVDEIITLTTEIKGNYPNPFNPTTTITYTLNSEYDEETEISIYNTKGQLIKTLVNDKMDAGEYQVTWNGTDEDNKPVSSGVYFYKMKAGNYSATKKMILMK